MIRAKIKASESSMTLQPTKVAAWLEHHIHTGGRVRPAMALHMRASWLLSGVSVRHLSSEEWCFMLATLKVKMMVLEFVPLSWQSFQLDFLPSLCPHIFSCLLLNYPKRKDKFSRKGFIYSKWKYLGL